MDSYQRLLVVIDEHDFSLKGVSRALYVASRTHAVVVVMLLEHGNFVNRLVDSFEHEHKAIVPTESQSLSLEKKRQCIQQFIKSTNRSGLPISFAAVTCSSCDDLLTFCHDLKVDAIFIAASRHKLWNWLTIKALDIRLIKESLKPIIIVKDHLWEPGGQIISFVETCSEDLGKKALNEKVLETTAFFIKLLKGHCHLIDNHPVDESYAAQALIETDSCTNQLTLHENNQFQQLSAYNNRYQLLPNDSKTVHEHFHFTRTLPENEIEALAKQVDSDLVILGQQASSDLTSNFYGNIAELVIDKINCDLLVVKSSH